MYFRKSQVYRNVVYVPNALLVILQVHRADDELCPSYCHFFLAARVLDEDLLLEVSVLPFVGFPRDDDKCAEVI